MPPEKSPASPLDKYVAGIRQGLHPEPLSQDQKFEIIDGEAHAQVHDTTDLRAAFLHYCSSNVKPSEMHLAMEGPFMAAQQFSEMARDIKLVEPIGPLPMLMLGITYATIKDDDDDGLSYPRFLDALLDLAFECGRNVAGEVQAASATRRLNKSSHVGSAGGERARRQSHMIGRSTWGGGSPGSVSTPGYHTIQADEVPEATRSGQTGQLMRSASSELQPPALSRAVSSIHRSRFSDFLGMTSPTQSQPPPPQRFAHVSASASDASFSSTPSPDLERLNSISRLRDRVTSAQTCRPMAAYRHATPSPSGSFVQNASPSSTQPSSPISPSNKFPAHNPSSGNPVQPPSLPLPSNPFGASSQADGRRNSSSPARPFKPFSASRSLQPSMLSATHPRSSRPSTTGGLSVTLPNSSPGTSGGLSGTPPSPSRPLPQCHSSPVSLSATSRSQAPALDESSDDEDPWVSSLQVSRDDIAYQDEWVTAASPHVRPSQAKSTKVAVAARSSQSGNLSGLLTGAARPEYANALRPPSGRMGAAGPTSNPVTRTNSISLQRPGSKMAALSDTAETTSPTGPAPPRPHGDALRPPSARSSFSGAVERARASTVPGFKASSAMPQGAGMQASGVEASGLSSHYSLQPPPRRPSTAQMGNSGRSNAQVRAQQPA